MPTFPKQFIERLIQEAGNDEDMLAVLDGLGLSISEVDGMNVINVENDGYDEDFDDYDDGGKPHLPKAEIETYIEEINKDQLVRVAKRFAPDTSAQTVAPLKTAVKKALKNPKHIKAVIDNLNPLEEELLLEAKRLGGVVNGWNLILHAIKLGFEPEPKGAKTSLYKVEASQHAGVKFILPLIRDCLLLPSSTYASWFERHYYGYQQSLDVENDVLQVDERILDALPDKAAAKAKSPKYKILKDIDASGFVQKHPLEAILKLNEVLKLIESSGGLLTNKDGSISRNTIKKLLKLAPWLEDELESYLEQIKPLGFLVVKQIDGKITLQVDRERLENFQTSPFAVSYCMLFDGFINSSNEKYDPAASQYGSDEVIHSLIARRALVDAVCQLPEEAVDLDAALKLMWKKKLCYLMRAKVSRAYYGSSNTVEERPMPKWFRHSILEELHTYGLVAIKETGKEEKQDVEVTRRYLPEAYVELDKTNYAIKITKAKDWWYKGRALNRALHLSPPQDAESYKKAVIEHIGAEHFDIDYTKPSQKSLLIQANFDILVYLDMLTPFAVAALNTADCTRIDAQTANYTISRASVYRALELGMTLEGILKLLENNSHDLPNNVKVSITEWANRRERLSVTENTTLLEFPTKKDRDTAHKKTTNSRPIAERFLCVPKEIEVKKTATTFHNYRAEPQRIIEFKDDGSFKLKGASDLAGRAVLAALAEQDSKGNYSLSTKAIQAGAFTKVAKESLLKRTKGSLPTQLSVLIDIWSGKTSSPAIGQVSIFQHASAKELAKHPSIAPLLTGQLGSTSFLIAEGKVTELNKVLKTLGIVANKTVEQNLEPKVVEKEESMKKGLPTRKMREMIETAISTERNLQLKYNEEKHTYDRYGYTRVSKGKSVTEEIIPDSVYYEGSTPYFYGKTVKNDKGRDIRIGYITEISVI